MSNYDEAVEALRQELNKLPRFSFFTDGTDGVVRVNDRSGRWIEWQSAHEMFDAEFVDCAIAAMQARRAIATAAAPKPEDK